MVRNSVTNLNFSCNVDAAAHHQRTQNNLLQAPIMQSALKLIADASHQAQLQAANFKWSYRKGVWYFCLNKNTPRSSLSTRLLFPIERLREKYRTQVVQL